MRKDWHAECHREAMIVLVNSWILAPIHFWRTTGDVRYIHIYLNKLERYLITNNNGGEELLVVLAIDDFRLCLKEDNNNSGAPIVDIDDDNNRISTTELHLVFSSVLLEAFCLAVGSYEIHRTSDHQV